MNRQNTVLIKQFPEHTPETVQEIINTLFTWNGKEKSKLAGQPAENTGPAPRSSTNGQIQNCDAVHPTDGRPWDPPAVLQAQRKGLYPPQRAQAAQDTRTWRDTWRSCRWLAPRRVPGMSASSPGVRLLRHNSTDTGQESQGKGNQTPHTVYRQPLKQPQLAGFHFQQSLVPATLCQVYAVRSAQ